MRVSFFRQRLRASAVPHCGKIKGRAGFRRAALIFTLANEN
jgi:hypothetical protein